MQKIQRRFLRNEQQAAMRRFADFIVRENKRFLLLLVQQQTAESAAKFFAYIFNSKTKHKPAEKIQCCHFLLNRRPHAKIQLILMKKITDQNLV